MNVALTTKWHSYRSTKNHSNNIFSTGDWVMSDDRVKSIIGGLVSIHQNHKHVSRLSGKVTKVELMKTNLTEQGRKFNRYRIFFELLGTTIDPTDFKWGSFPAIYW